MDNAPEAAGFDPRLAELQKGETFWLESIDEEIHQDLVALGITAAFPDQLEQAHRDALAGVLMRRMQELEREYDALNDAFKLELQLLQHSFSRRLTPISTKRNELEAQVKMIARASVGAQGFGSKKSRDVGYGTYGARTIPTKFELGDPAICLAWAEEHDPEVVRVTVQTTLDVYQRLTIPSEIASKLVEKKREVLVSQVKAKYAAGEEPPPGCIVVGPHEEYYAKPESLQ
jgi:hypothetical protein